MLVAPVQPLDLGATAGIVRRGGGDPTARLRPGELWWSTRTPEGPGTLHLRSSDEVVEARAWGPGGGWLEAQVPRLLGQDDDDTGFDATLHPVVERARHRHPGLRLARTDVVVPTVVSTVLGQRVTSVEAGRQWASLCRRLGDPAPGPAGLWLPPVPERVAEQPSWWYHRIGIERRRADTLRRVGRHAARLEEAAGFDLGAAWARLGAVRGLGPWTVAAVAAVAFGDPDAVPVGDDHLPDLVAWALAGEPRATDARMLELLEPFVGHRGRVVRLLLADGHRPPRFGSRQRIVSIAHW